VIHHRNQHGWLLNVEFYLARNASSESTSSTLSTVEPFG
jgi:hypothetical protein